MITPRKREKTTQLSYLYEDSSEPSLTYVVKSNADNNEGHDNKNDTFHDNHDDDHDDNDVDNKTDDPTLEYRIL